jgi:hypothetical protein
MAAPVVAAAAAAAVGPLCVFEQSFRAADDASEKRLKRMSKLSAHVAANGRNVTAGDAFEFVEGLAGVMETVWRDGGKRVFLPRPLLVTVLDIRTAFLPVPATMLAMMVARRAWRAAVVWHLEQQEEVCVDMDWSQRNEEEDAHPCSEEQKRAQRLAHGDGEGHWRLNERQHTLLATIADAVAVLSYIEKAFAPRLGEVAHLVWDLAPASCVALRRALIAMHAVVAYWSGASAGRLRPPGSPGGKGAAFALVRARRCANAAQLLVDNAGTLVEGGLPTCNTMATDASRLAYWTAGACYWAQGRPAAALWCMAKCYALGFGVDAYDYLYRLAHKQMGVEWARKPPPPRDWPRALATDADEFESEVGETSSRWKGPARIALVFPEVTT